jgi:hypothetical protein
MIERIKNVAIRQKGAFFSPVSESPLRHNDLIKILVECNLPTPIIGEQGFITDTGRFVDRKDALEIAKESGQIIEKHGNFKVLYSEDMW